MVDAITTALALKKNYVDVRLYGTKGNGVNDDTAAIQAAIADASRKGIGAVYFPAPDAAYMVDVRKPIIVPSNMILFGNKGQSVVKVIASTVHNDNDHFFGGINSLFVPGTLADRRAFTKDAFGSHIQFDGLVLDGNASSIDQTGYLKEANSAGFKCLYVKNLTITNCEVRNFLNSGIYTYGCTFVAISRNQVHHNGQFAYTAQNGYSYSNGVSRNGISLSGGYLPGQSVQESPYSYDYEVTNNIVHDNMDEGIMFAYQKRLLISGNFVHNNGDMGIEGDGGYKTTDTMPDVPGTVIPGDVIIVNNFIYDHPHKAISIGSSNMQKIKVSGNVIRNCGEWAIFIGQESNSTVIVTDNNIHNYGTEIAQNGTNYHAIYVESHHVKIQDNYIYAPVFDPAAGVAGGTSTGSGIVVSRAYDCTIQDNTVFGGGKLGIIVDIWRMSDLGEIMRTLKVEGNTISHVHRQGIYINANLSTHMHQAAINNNNIYNYQAGYDYSGGQSYTLYSGIEFGSSTRIKSLTTCGNTVMNEMDQTIITSTGQPLNKVPGQNAINLPSTQDNIVNCTLVGNEVAYGGQFVSVNNTDKVQFLTMPGNNIFGKRLLYGSAVPSGAVKQYYVGDVMYHTAPADGTAIGWVCVASGKPGTWAEFGFIKSQRSGQIVYNGNGAAMTKVIPHGLGAVPSAYFVQAVSIDAGNAVVKRVAADAANLTVTFGIAPVTGTNNVTLNWRAEL
ncbi:right-handed parallel beta-helix repeat-containing protein [Paenibacillus sp. R14(2021)]|uniref:right-handed parallel beta-helix repeat-containing protein n=1 Tax=Paenibacillus sp. R14(2021) TaxID=2859228 RepID=UPI001C611E1F|nr:right-handed parallel beta-helix repeat-containing protein [Paenibacillus sp. R14(2021)]